MLNHGISTANRLSSALKFNTDMSCELSYKNKPVALCFLCLVLGIITFLSGCFNFLQSDKTYYEKGCEEFESGDFASAKQSFINSNGYLNSIDFLDAIVEYEKIYSDALEKLESCEYETALSLFSSIPQYLNSNDFIAYIESLSAHFETGVSLYSQGDYLNAYIEFVGANGYSVSSDYIENISAMCDRFNRAMALYNDGNYSDAAAMFDAIGTTLENSDEMLLLCQKKQALELASPKQFIRDFNSQFDDESIKIDKGAIDEPFFNIKDNRGIDISGTLNDSGKIRFINFVIPDSLVDGLSQTEVATLYAQLIFPLNINVMPFDELVSMLDATIRLGFIYGGMEISFGTIGDSHVIQATAN